VPLTTRKANPDGKGEVSMLDLMINSLRMRPDRIVVGEIRRGDQAEVLFEAMHTGHSVYATLHADTVDQVIRRMINPPINIPDVMMEALHIIVVQYRDRRLGARRTYQLAELLPMGESGEKIILKPNILYRCKPNGEIVAHDECIRTFDILKMHTGLSQKELVSEIGERMKILDWLVKQKINSVNDVGKILAEFYADPEKIYNSARKNENAHKIINE
jgi:flagellar protein FlaI